MKREDFGKNAYGGEGERLHHRGEDMPAIKENGNGRNFLTPDRIFHMAVSVITVLLAIIGATISFSEKASSVVTSIKDSIASQNLEILKLVQEQKKMREDLDEHKDTTREVAETRARYHHTSMQLNCALCKGAVPDHPCRKPLGPRECK